MTGLFYLISYPMGTTLNLTKLIYPVIHFKQLDNIPQVLTILTYVIPLATIFGLACMNVLAMLEVIPEKLSVFEENMLTVTGSLFISVFGLVPASFKTIDYNVTAIILFSFYAGISLLFYITLCFYGGVFMGFVLCIPFLLIWTLAFLSQC